MLKLQYFGYLMQRAISLAKTLMLGKIEGRRRRGQQRMRWLDGITDWMDLNLNGSWIWASSRRWWRTGKPGMLQFMGSQRAEHDWTTTAFSTSNWERLKAREGAAEDEMVRQHQWFDGHESEQWTWTWMDMNGHGHSMDMNQETVEDRGAWQAAARDIAKSQAWLSNWTTISKRAEIGSGERWRWRITQKQNLEGL